MSDCKRSRCQLLKKIMYCHDPSSEEIQGGSLFKRLSSRGSLHLCEALLKLELFHEIWGCELLADVEFPLPEVIGWLIDQVEQHCVERSSFLFFLVPF